MSRRPPLGKKDGNHDAIVATFLALGCSVAEFAATSLPGWPDTVVGCVGVNHLVEIKDKATRYGREGLNKNQTAFARDWRGERVWLCCSVDEATALVQNWRKRS
jgi:hypothetical protein